MSVPKTQKAAVRKNDGTIAVEEIAVPEPGPDQILVKINYSGLCGSDKSLLKDEWQFKMTEATHGIAGHEGAGEVVSVGSNVNDLWKVGDRAGIKWIASVCRKCEFCVNGQDECHCPKQLNSGFTIAGTFQEYAVTDAHYATRLPDGVKDEEAGPLMCGGVTAYVACKRSAVRPGGWVVIPGAGGGLGHLGIQYARSMGMRVIAVDGGDAKRDLCLKLGAEKYIDFSSTQNIPEEVMKITTYGAHGVIVFAATRAAYDQAPALLRPGGTVVCVGLPKDASVVAGAPPVMMCMKRLNVVGSVVGTLQDVKETLDLTARGLVHPILTHGGLDDIGKFCDELDQGKLAGRAVIKVAA
ncbi:alcohol dehydrogenase [Sporormia fimetaria CBS 119925]|uniref:Alcohol dehydrogenase n=1 Tax=Sporormia fimetaria CBS 119925 TaxID=1340428 RepID=A0A6A6V0D6_9PLEO|nr:alcohol dehydrogenase [Sporormia fimetaria CBS 119925]